MKNILLHIFLFGAVATVSANNNTNLSCYPYKSSCTASGSHFLIGFSRNAFYAAMASENISLIDGQLSEINSAPSDIKNAFLGAMTMKKAGIGGNPISKLMLFTKGHGLLEDAIKRDPDNVEFRFLRLMIQENAPWILGYQAEEEMDSEFIRKSFRSLPEDLQKTITSYNKKSKLLKLQAP
jgi:hypothetical protein